MPPVTSPSSRPTPHCARAHRRARRCGEASDAQLVDIRSADEYNGKIFAPQGVQELAVRAGHVPGAVNVPWGQAVAADGTFKSKDELSKVYAAVGIDGSKPVITYCRIGERSSHTWFALSKILGYEVSQLRRILD